jgi:rubrerythrin
MTEKDLNEIEMIKQMASIGAISKNEVLRQLKVPDSVIQQVSTDMARQEQEHLEATQKLLQQRVADEEYRVAYNKERMEALKTLFPRGHSQIRDIDKMVDIAREDQLNPLYEQVLKDFDDAKLIMARAANKLAQAVKLTDSEKLEELNRKEQETLYGNSGIMGAKGVMGNSSISGMNSAKSQNWSTTLSQGVTMAAGPMGPTGAVGMTGPKGDKGDPGVDGQKGDKGDRGPWFGAWLWDRIVRR